MEYIAIQYIANPFNIIYAVFALDKGSQTFQTIGDFTTNRFAVNPTALLEVGKLGNLDVYKRQPMN